MPQRSTPVKAEKPADPHAELRRAAKHLDRVWSASGFFDRQEAELALALHDALIALKT